jgi:hypothetical protein
MNLSKVRDEERQKERKKDRDGDVYEDGQRQTGVVWGTPKNGV